MFRISHSARHYSLTVCSAQKFNYLANDKYNTAFTFRVKVEKILFKVEYISQVHILSNECQLLYKRLEFNPILTTMVFVCLAVDLVQVLLPLRSDVLVGPRI